MNGALDAYGDPFAEIVRLRRAGRRVVLCTVVSAVGSTPREAGARMLVLEDGTIRGTIGGGVREGEIVAAARDVFESGGARLVAVDFTAGVKGGEGPVCGGTMEVFMERIDPPRRVVIAGAGHVGLFVHRFLALLEVETVVLDERAELASGERFPGATLRVGPFDGGLADLPLGAGDGVVIVTPGHVDDEAVLRQALATDAGYIGMIGSGRKVATVLSHLRADGYDEGRIARVHAPIGIDIAAETPAEIALAIAAEIVSVWRGEPGGRRRARGRR
jgi:xanthine dehydrogenase accessory factor